MSITYSSGGELLGPQFVLYQRKNFPMWASDRTLVPVYADWKMTLTVGRANYGHSSYGGIRTYYI